VKSNKKYQLDIEIDRLTNSIENSISGDSFLTYVLSLTKTDLKVLSKKNGWLFNWAAEYKTSNKSLFKLTIRDNANVVQGVMSISDEKDHCYIHLIESAPFNIGKKKLYIGVPGNLFAYACKLSKEKGYKGFVSFTSKSRLIDHYHKTLGATLLGHGPKMIIYPDAVEKLINQYFKL